MLKPIKCCNCKKVIGESYNNISEIQVSSCGSEVCNKVASKKAKEIFDNHYKDKPFRERMDMLMHY